MDNFKREIVKGLIQSGKELRNVFMVDGNDLYFIKSSYETWIEGLIDAISSIDLSYAEFLKAISENMDTRVAKMSPGNYFGGRIIDIISSLERLLRGQPPKEAGFTLPNGVLKDDVELIFDFYKLYDADCPDDYIELREGLSKNILMAFFPNDEPRRDRILESEIPGYVRKTFYRDFIRLQNNWAKAFYCTRSVIKTLIYRDKGYLYITDKIKTNW